MVHLGVRVSALLDGRLPAAEAEKCWAHVDVCPPCRDLVEREGWLKRQLAGLSVAQPAVPLGLKAQLCATSLTPPEREVHRAWSRPMVAMGGSALGVAVIGAIALGTGAPMPRGPVASVGGGTPSPSQSRPVSGESAAGTSGATSGAGGESRRSRAQHSLVAALDGRACARVIEVVVSMSPRTEESGEATTVATTRGVRGTMVR